jgi:hypothetical protein
MLDIDSLYTSQSAFARETFGKKVSISQVAHLNGFLCMAASEDQGEESAASRRSASDSSKRCETVTCAREAAHEGDEQVFRVKLGFWDKNWENAARVFAKIFICRVTTSR